MKFNFKKIVATILAMTMAASLSMAACAISDTDYEELDTTDANFETVTVNPLARVSWAGGTVSMQTYKTFTSSTGNGFFAAGNYTFSTIISGNYPNVNLCIQKKDGSGNLTYVTGTNTKTATSGGFYRYSVNISVTSPTTFKPAIWNGTPSLVVYESVALLN